MAENNYIQLISWAYFWVGNLVICLYGWQITRFLLGWDKKVSLPYNWKTFLFLMLWLISIRLK